MKRARLVATLLALPAALAICEVVVRLGWVGPTPRPRVEGTVIRPSPLPALGFEPAPFATRTTLWRDRRSGPVRRVEQRTNARGLRGPDVATPKPAGVLRIVCAGDSHTFGDGVADDDTWPARLSALLASRHPDRRIEVVNAGVNGYDSAQEALFVLRRLLPLEPDVLVLQYFINDVGSRMGAVAGERTHEPHWAHPLLDGRLAAVRRRSALVDALCDTVYRRGHLTELGAWFEEDYTADSERWRFTESVLSALAREVGARDVAFGIALYPLMARGRDGGLASDRAFEVVGARLAAHGIPYVDASPAFAGRDPIGLRVAPGDLHAGPEAHGLFAAAVADWLDGLGWCGAGLDGAGRRP